MKSRKKQTLSIIVAFIMAVSVFVPFGGVNSAYAADVGIAAAGDTFSVTGVESVSVLYKVLKDDPDGTGSGKGTVQVGDGTNRAIPAAPSGTITIPATVTSGGNTYDVVGIGGYAFVNCTGLVDVIMPDSVSAIGDVAFAGCESLALTELPEGVTAIGGEAFDRCYSLALTELPEGVTAIGFCTFYNCTNLALTELPEDVTTIGIGAFFGCRNLALTELPEGVTAIGDEAFYNCDSLVLTELPEGVTAIGYQAFSYCTNLALTELPEGVTAIGTEAFDRCTNLALTAIPDSVTSIGPDAFRDCPGITELTFTSNPAPEMGYHPIQGYQLDVFNRPVTIYYPAGAAGYDNLSAWGTHDVTITGVPYTAPTVVNVGITGTPKVGKELTGSYGYTAGTEVAAGDDASAYRWYRSDAATWGGGTPEAITDADGKTYTPTGADVGKYLYFEVIPSNGTIDGTPAQSAAIFTAAPTEYTVTATAGKNGSISPKGSVKVTEGSAKTFAVKPNTGYKVDKVTVNGKAVALSNGKYTMSNIQRNMTISATFKANVYKVTFQGNSGKIKKGSKYSLKKLTKSYAYGSKYGTLPLAKRTGYKFKGWYTKKTGGTKVAKTTAMKSTKNINLYARWTKNGKIVKCKTTRLRTGPGVSYKTKGYVKKNQTICVIKTVKNKSGNRWYKVKVGKKTGYIYSKYVKYSK